MPHAEIATKQATLTLEQLHAELAGKIADNKAEAARLAKAMKHVEAVLKIMDPTYNLRRIAVRRRKPNPHFKRGTIFRAALDVLRVAEKPLTTREIVARLFSAKGISAPSAHDRRTLEGAVQSSLRNHNGATVKNAGEGMPARWIISGAR